MCRKLNSACLPNAKPVGVDFTPGNIGSPDKAASQDLAAIFPVMAPTLFLSA